MRSLQPATALVQQFPDKGQRKFDREEWETQFNDANVIIHCKGQDIYYPQHWGPLSLKCAFGGNEFYQKQQCKYAVGHDHFLLLNEGTTYSSYIERGVLVESLTINFSSVFHSDVSRAVMLSAEKLTDDPFAPHQPVSLEEKLYTRCPGVELQVQRLRMLTREFDRNRSQIDEVLYFLLESLLHMNDTISQEIDRIHATRSSTRKEIYRRLNQVKDHIDSCYQEEINLDRLATIAWMSPFHLLRQFKKNFHLTPYQYLVNRRLEEAKNRIVETDWPVHEICFRTGFSDASSFSKLFRRRFGLSPQHYRKMQKGY